MHVVERVEAFLYLLHVFLELGIGGVCMDRRATVTSSCEDTLR